MIKETRNMLPPWDMNGPQPETAKKAEAAKTMTMSEARVLSDALSQYLENHDAAVDRTTAERMLDAANAVIADAPTGTKE
jgi:hypothetical protein